MHCFGSFLLQDMYLNLQVFFWGTKYDVYCERVAYLYSIILWLRARLWSLELFVCKYSRGEVDSYHGYHVFLRRCRSFTSRELYVCLEKFLWFSCTIWSSARYPLIVLVPQDSNVTLYTQSLLTSLRVTYAIVQLSSSRWWSWCIFWTSVGNLIWM